MPWTPPISILYALDVALQRYHAEGMTAAFGRHARYARAVRAALEQLDFTLVSRPGAHSVAVVAAYTPAGVSTRDAARTPARDATASCYPAVRRTCGQDRALRYDGRRSEPTFSSARAIELRCDWSESKRTGVRNRIASDRVISGVA